MGKFSITPRVALILFIAIAIVLIGQAVWWIIFMARLVDEKVQMAIDLGADQTFVDLVHEQEIRRQIMVGGRYCSKAVRRSHFSIRPSMAWRSSIGRVEAAAMTAGSRKGTRASMLCAMDIRSVRRRLVLCSLEVIECSSRLSSSGLSMVFK